jgi:glycine cleavage system H protein
MVRIDRYEVPEDLYYDKAEHLWVRVEGDTLRLGLDAWALDALGNVVYLDLVSEGATLRRGEPMGTVEAEKMVRPLVAPVSGTVVGRNGAALENPLRINGDPYDSGWLILVEPTNWPAEAAELVQGPAVADWIREEIASYTGNPPHQRPLPAGERDTISRSPRPPGERDTNPRSSRSPGERDTISRSPLPTGEREG